MKLTQEQRQQALAMAVRVEILGDVFNDLFEAEQWQAAAIVASDAMALYARLLKGDFK